MNWRVLEIIWRRLYEIKRRFALHFCRIPDLLIMRFCGIIAAKGKNMSRIIKDSNGKMLATIHNTGTQTYLKDFTTGKVLASYRPGTDTTLDWTKNQPVKGNQILRFVTGK